MKYLYLWSVILFCSLSGFSQSSRINPHPQPNDDNSFSPSITNDSTFDVKHYHIDVLIDIDRPLINGRVTYLITSKVEGLKQIKLDLDAAFKIKGHSTEVRDYQFEQNVLTVFFKKSFDKEEEITFSIEYGGTPILAGGYKGLRYETHDIDEPIIASLSTPYLAHTWWPCKDGTSDKADSTFIDITIRDTSINNKPVMAVSNGILEGINVENGFKTFSWRHRYPSVPYYIMVAISNYTHFQQEFVSDNYQFPMDYYVFESHLDDALVGVSKMPDVMQFFTEKFGPYPFKSEKYGMTQLGYYGGIENQTNSIVNKMNLGWFNVSVHELAHQWFADMITCETWNHGWLNEGFATYAEALYKEHEQGFTSYQNYVKDFEYFDGGKLYLEDVSNPFNVFRSIIYNKGAFTLHMLRGVMGDSTFFQSIYNYATDPKYKYDLASTEAFQAVCEATSGLDLEFFFSQWIYDERYPTYKYNFYQNDQDNELQISLIQTQELLGWRPIFEMPVQLKINFEDQSDTIVTVWNNKQVQTFSFNTSKAVESVDFEPNNWILHVSTYDPGITVGAHHPFDADIQVSPNPCFDAIFIRNAPAGAFTIFDSNGKAVLNSSLKKSPFKLNIGHLPYGHYILQFHPPSQNKPIRFIKL